MGSGFLFDATDGCASRGRGGAGAGAAEAEAPPPRDGVVDAEVVDDPGPGN